MSSTVLPALDGREPLGFLAALGALRLLTVEGGRPALSWDVTTGQAVLTGVGSIDEVVDRLVELATNCGDALVPTLPIGWPPKKPGASGKDPSHLIRPEFTARLIDGDARWAAALWTDLGLDKEGKCQRTPFSAPMGQQTLESMFANPAELVRPALRERLTEALTGWRRVVGFTGENFDIQAISEAAESQIGKSQPRGVPGATWLALAALPYFRMSGNGKAATTVGWRFGARKAETRFGWPLWRQPLASVSVEVLLDHPAVAAALRRGPEDERDEAELRALGVFAVVRAMRRQTSAAKSDGILVTEAIW